MSMQWRKSSYSGGVEDKQCIELGRLSSGIGVRDSKAPDSGHLTFTPAQFALVITQIKQHAER